MEQSQSAWQTAWTCSCDATVLYRHVFTRPDTPGNSLTQGIKARLGESSGYDRTACRRVLSYPGGGAMLSLPWQLACLCDPPLASRPETGHAHLKPAFIHKSQQQQEATLKTTRVHALTVQRHYVGAGDEEAAAGHRRFYWLGVVEMIWLDNSFL